MSGTLSELEDRVLAMCEGERIDFLLATQVAESWFGQPIPVVELAATFERLAQLGFVECQLGESWSFTNVVPPVARIRGVKFKATSKGIEYLRRTGRKASNDD